MVLMLTTHPRRDGDIVGEETMQFSPGVKSRDFFDPFGNICTRLIAPLGLLEVRSEFIVETVVCSMWCAQTRGQWAVGDLPDDVPFLLANRYCDTAKPSNLHGPRSAASNPAGSAHRRSAITPLDGKLIQPLEYELSLNIKGDHSDLTEREQTALCRETVSAIQFFISSIVRTETSGQQDIV